MTAEHTSTDGATQPLGVGLSEGLGAGAEARCWCRACNRDTKGPGGWPYLATTFVVCPDCGNKRCPKANDHQHACTGSNDAGQLGSAYGSAQEFATSEDPHCKDGGKACIGCLMHGACLLAAAEAPND